ncbi:MAG TPA: DNA-directed RNA polymerase subunit omega [Thermoanaerobaculia bacterium]|jgi:DNA-directed RNA polymerase subunit K/omega|nr:DNA-directed RNA polymerase subunit omega [Thermoanaerobaculia bacterium]
MANETDTRSVRESMDSKFRYVLLVAERAEQLMRGARPKTDAGGKATRVARDEIDHGLVEWGYGPAPVPELEALPEEDGEVEATAAAEADEPETATESEVH